MRARICVSMVVMLVAASPVARAQDWSFDARSIGLGGAGSSGNLATEMIEEERYRAIVLPFGLFQVLRDFDIYNPDSSKFDPVRAVEYAASPLHYIVNRDSSPTGQAFVTAIRNATFSRDLNVYRGFNPANEATGEGLANIRWGGTIKVVKHADGTFHGVYIGAGPYLSVRTTTLFDPQLTALLASSTPVILPNAQLPITDASQGQFALGITGGYRGRFSLGSGSGGRGDGLYVAANYNYLRGLQYQDFGVTVRFDTDASGLLTFVPSRPPPVAVARQSSTSGQGFAIDLAVGAVMDHVEVGFSANGLGNRIEWTDVDRTTYTLPNLLSGNATFLESATTRLGTVRVELPVDYRGHAGYRGDDWTAAAEVGHGLGGTSLHAGVERHLGRLDVRGGARYTLTKWNPSGGLGFNLSRRVALDVAGFGTTANIERRRKLALAASVRINAKH